VTPRHLVPLLAAALLACSSGTDEGPSGPPLRIIRGASGTQILAHADVWLGTARVVNAATLQPVAGVAIAFCQLPAGIGTLDVAGGVSDAGGNVAVEWTVPQPAADTARLFAGVQGEACATALMSFDPR
jgi:hypothetical protein